MTYHLDNVIRAHSATATAPISLPEGVTYEPCVFTIDDAQSARYQSSGPLDHQPCSTYEPPSSCFAASQVVEAYEHDAFSSETPTAFDLQPEDIFSLFADQYDDVAQLVDQTATTNEMVALDLSYANAVYSAPLDPSPVDHVYFENWDYNMYPGAGIHSYGNITLSVGDEMEDTTLPSTFNGLTLDDVVICSDIEVVMAADSKGNLQPMATCYVMVRSVNGKSAPRMLKALFDTGGTVSLGHRSIVPEGAVIAPPPDSSRCNTIAGTYQPAGQVTLEDIKLPEFDANLLIDKQELLIFDAECKYDLILGNDFLIKMGLVIDLENLELSWQGRTIPMNSKFSKERLSACIEACRFQEEVDDGVYDSFASAIDDSTYDKMNIDQVIEECCPHLTSEQQTDMRRLLAEYHTLFDGTLLRTYKGAKMDIELQPDAVPVFRRPYPVPHIHLETFRKELYRLVEIGVLERAVGPQPWALPSFIIAKKDNKVRFLADLRELNKQIKHRDYNLPIIQDIIRKRTGYRYMSKVDLSMMFYSFELTDAAKKLSTISTPFGLFHFNRAPMGLRNSPAFAQSVIEAVLVDIPQVEVYIDDIGIWSNSWEEHVEVLKTVFSRLQEAGFSVNPLKCEIAVEQSDFLGHWLTPRGVSPWQKKIQAVLDLDRPKTASDVRTFVGLLNWYRDFWPRRSHLLAPFTSLLSGLSGNKRAPIQWTDELERCFNEVKKVISEQTLLVYPNHNEVFEVYCDASDFALGCAILQNGMPVAYYSKRLTGPQTRYSTIEKELLAIVSALTEYRTMLYGAKIRIYTDHRNLTFNNLSNQRVLRWRLFLEQFNAEWYYLEGKLNILADAFSHLPKFDYSGAEERQESLSMEPVPFDPEAELPNESSFAQLFSDMANDDNAEALERFAHHYMNVPSTMQNPLRYQWLAECQTASPALQAKLQQAPDKYHRRAFGRDEVELICYTPTPNVESSIKIALPDDAVNATVEFFHLMLNHPGAAALTAALSKFYHPQLSARAKQFSCDTCQRNKVGHRAYGHFPPRSVQDLTPWKQVDCDLIGPWYISTTGRSGKAYEFYALTAIDRASGFPDGIPIKRKTSQYVAAKFKENWLSRYPRPEVCAHDQGGEFIGPQFQQLLFDAGIKSAPSTARNPQSNAVVERLHLTMGNSIRAQLADKEPRTLAEAEDIMQAALAGALYAVRTNVSEATGHAPGSLAFHRDMIHNLPVEYDMPTINDRRQRRVDSDTQRINSKRYAYDYQVGDQVLKKVFDYTKLDPRWDGPFTINRVHINGTLTISTNKPHISERVNIRRVKPYKTTTPSSLTPIQQDAAQVG